MLLRRERRGMVWFCISEEAFGDHCIWDRGIVHQISCGRMEFVGHDTKFASARSRI